MWKINDLKYFQKSLNLIFPLENVAVKEKESNFEERGNEIAFHSRFLGRDVETLCVTIASIFLSK